MLMRKNNSEQSDNMLLGSITHDLNLFPEQFKEKYLVGPTVKRNTKAWKEFVEEHPDKTIITSVMSEKAFRMRDALHNNPRIREILECNETLKECSIWVEHSPTGLLLKCRPDILLDGVIYDLKTTIKPHKEAFYHSCKQYGMTVQSVMYPDVCEQIGMRISGFEFLVVGSNRPHLTAMYKLGEDLGHDGWVRYQRGLEELHRYYFTDDKWDGLSYGRETVTL
jgi:exodeoxyribonuclease VIII